MHEYLAKSFRGVLSGIAAIALGATLTAGEAVADTNTNTNTSGQRVILGERYIPTIWVDPDGCEHWVMDDGWEGYMTPHVNRQGIPVCRRGNVCGEMHSDQLFATNSAHISAAGREHLAKFFRTTGAISYIITGHTDSRASDQYNLDLSYRRATAVASIAAANGARIRDGY